MLPTSPEIGARLPFTFAYLIMCLCIYGFVHRRYSAGYALAAMVYLLHHLVFYYATEARAYALVLAGVGVAMFCWQAAISGRHRSWSLFGLWFGLAFAVNAHAFAIFLFVPFALAQLTRDFREKKMDWATWVALVLFPIGLLPVLPGEMLAGKVYSANFWSRPQVPYLFEFVPDFFFSYLSYLIALCIVATGGILLRRQGLHRFSESRKGGFSAPEWVLVAAIAFLPLYVVPASYALHVYAPRYVISYSIGLVVLAIGAVAQLAGRNRIAGVALFALFLAGSARSRVGNMIEGVDALAHPGHVHEQLQARFNNLQWVKILEQSQLPIATDQTSTYASIDYYARPGVGDRLYPVTDLREESKYPESTTGNLNFRFLGNRILKPSLEISDFVSEHPHFLMPTDERKGVFNHWLHPYLVEQQQAGNASLVCVGPGCGESGINVFEVQFSKMPAHAQRELDANLLKTR
jgi:hypothetical protein